MIILRKPGSRTMSPRVLELSQPTDSGPGQKTLKLEGGAVIESKRLRTEQEYLTEMNRALAMGFAPVKREPTVHRPETDAERQMTLGVHSGMGVGFMSGYVEEDEDP